jgi:hypothetical protein
MPEAPSAEVLAKLNEAMDARRAAAQAVPSITPPPVRFAKQPTTVSTAAGLAPGAGNATAKYLLVDHYFGGSAGTFWAYDTGTSQWYGAAESEPGDEQGIAQVAFAANRVDVNWNADSALTLARCWKYF